MKQLKSNASGNQNPETGNRDQSEIKLQSAAWQWVWNTYPGTRLLMFHVPNGGFRSKVEAAQLKASGVLAGIPDILFIWKGRLYGFEFKRPNEHRVSPAQQKVHIKWGEHNIPVYIITELERFQFLVTHIISNG